MAELVPTVDRRDRGSLSPEQIGLYIADLAFRGLLVDADVLDAVRDDTAPS